VARGAEGGAVEVGLVVVVVVVQELAGGVGVGELAGGEVVVGGGRRAVGVVELRGRGGRRKACCWCGGACLRLSYGAEWSAGMGLYRLVKNKFSRLVFVFD